MIKLSLKSVYSHYEHVSHIQILYNLLKERSTEDDEYTNISHRKLPKYQDHVEYVNRHPYALWFLAMENNECLGSISLTKRNEIGVVLFKKYRGKGYGTRILELFLAENEPLPEEKGQRSDGFIANINPKNEASIRLFKKFGFEHVQNTYQLEKI